MKLFKASSHQWTIPHIFLEIPEVGQQYACILLLLLLRALRQETHPSFYKRKTHDLQVICGGRTFCFSLWYKREVCIRSLGKIRLDKQIEIHVETRDNDICLDKEMSWRQRQIYSQIMLESVESDWWLCYCYRGNFKTLMGRVLDVEKAFKSI